MNLVERFRFNSRKLGTRVLILGAIHGDEVCGPKAIERVAQKLQSGEIVLEQGSITLVPIANPSAHEAGKRMLGENLNRIFRKTSEPKSYEAKLANELCALVDECDVLLDIHSTAAQGPVNLFIDYPTKENVAFAEALNAEYAILDWPAVYENNPFAFPAWTTDRYAHEAGKIGVLVECGKHDDVQALKRAEEAILRTLIHFNLIAPIPGLTIPTSNPKPVYMNRIFQRNSEKDVFTQKWSHLDFLPTGTCVATRESGERIAVDHDSYILFPKDYAPPGGEWFYLGSAKWGIERS